MGWVERGISPTILVEDLDALLVALDALHALPPRCEIVVVAHDGRLEPRVRVRVSVWARARARASAWTKARW